MFFFSQEAFIAYILIRRRLDFPVRDVGTVISKGEEITCAGLPCNSREKEGYNIPEGRIKIKEGE